MVDERIIVGTITNELYFANIREIRKRCMKLRTKIFSNGILMWRHLSFYDLCIIAKSHNFHIQLICRDIIF